MISSYNFTYMIRTCMIFISIISAIFIIQVLLKKLFSKNIIANCWFCSLNTSIPRGNNNCWTCPYCDQYNGFNVDGDYNKKIPSQYHEDMNHGIGAIKTNQLNKMKQKYFCDICLEKQSRLIEALNQFVPKVDKKFSEEYANYKTKLDERYGLCYVCKTRVQDQLNSINNEILPDYIKWSIKQKNQQSIENRKSYCYFRQLKFIPTIAVGLCLLSQLGIYLSPYYVFRNFLMGIFVKYQYWTNFLIFLFVVLISKYRFVRPPIRFTNIQLIKYFLVILYSLLLSYFDKVMSSKLEKSLKTLPLIWITVTFLGFIRNFVYLARIIDYKKFSLIMSPSKSQPKYHLPNNISVDDHLYNIGGQSYFSTSSNSNYTSSYATLKPSKLNYVKPKSSKGFPENSFFNRTVVSPNSELSARNLSSLNQYSSLTPPSTPSMVSGPFSRQSYRSINVNGNASNRSPDSIITNRSIFSHKSSLWNFDSISQCPSVRSIKPRAPSEVNSLSGRSHISRSRMSSASFRTARTHRTSFSQPPDVPETNVDKLFVFKILIGAVLGALVTLIIIVTTLYVEDTFTNYL